MKNFAEIKQTINRIDSAVEKGKIKCALDLTKYLQKLLIDTQKQRKQFNEILEWRS